jgi:hypothetical protein
VAVIGDLLGEEAPMFESKPRIHNVALSDAGYCMTKQQPERMQCIGVLKRAVKESYLANLKG